ncbi:kinase inhibitor [Paenibacillus sp. FSL H8-0548]|uniref:5-oxoprolinase subunit PxpB n=1 Tax=Paenibacillus sp. FSL H8-0548 TaxID=1920422 RepID=UPI00096CF42E|nr:5-oxoprolinase subunit PxpB [Paenibacillus sp. FSL H8-0548]OMF24424.1 kinase inhibitor [Paenibacillus sp. FSL H8-0548]
MEKTATELQAPIEMLPLGDSAIIIRLGSSIDEETNRIVMNLSRRFEEKPFAGLIECVPSFVSVAIHYDPLLVKRSRAAAELQHATIFETVCARVQTYLSLGQLNASGQAARTIEIPVCYGGEHGPDLGLVAEHNGLTEEEVIAIHAGGIYLVHMLGFAPGFPYLGGMSERIAAPRHQTPRTIIPQGSVGIAGKQTGVYSIATPGGWQLIGRTPLALFRPQDEIPSLLRPGDSVRFKPITERQYKLFLEGEL